jgi:hypothetical protein
MWLSAVGLLSVLWLSSALASEKSTASKFTEPKTCGEFGTTIDFEPTPSDAARKALKEEKLVLVLHISGLFEDPDFT